MIAKIIRAIEPQPFRSFLTLSSTPGTSWPTLMNRWQRYVAWLRHQIPELHYVAVKEEGAVTGMRHLHVILYPWVWIDQAKLSAKWEQLTGASHVWVQRLSNEKAAGYIAKYLTKAPPGVKKAVTYSTNWPKLKPFSSWVAAEAVTMPTRPQPVYGETARNELIQKLGKGCDCIGGILPLKGGTILWLESLRDRSPPVFPGAWVTSPSSVPSSVRSSRPNLYPLCTPALPPF